MASKESPQDAIGTKVEHVNTAADMTQDAPNVHEAKVLSVELADAIAKDKPNYRSRSQIAMYGFMLFATLSMSNNNCPCIH